MEAGVTLRTADVTIKRAWSKIPAPAKTAFFTAFAVGILTHAFMLTNKIPNHDDLMPTVNDPHYFASGRWFLWFPATISGAFSVPWINGVLAIFYLALAAALVVSLIRIKKSLYAALTAGVMAATPAFAAVLLYMYLADAYIFALLLAVFAAYTAVRFRYGFIAAVVPLALSLGIYQSFFGVAALLFIIVLIKEILANELPWQKTLRRGLRFFATLAADMAAYVVVARLTAPPDGLNSYQNIDQIGSIDISMLPTYLFNAYKGVPGFLFFNTRHFHYPFMGVIFALFFLLCGISLLLFCRQKKLYSDRPRLALLIVLLLLFPLTANLNHLTGATYIHDLMIYGLLFVPVLGLVLVDFFSGEISRGKNLFAGCVRLSAWVVTATLLLTVFNYWVKSNQAYFRLFLGYEQTYAQSLLLVSRIQGLEGYTDEAGVVLAGGMLIRQSIPELSDVTLTGTSDIGLFGAHSYANFLSWYLGFGQEVLRTEIDQIDDADIRTIVEEMPIYWEPDSLKMIDSDVYVRFY